MKKFNEKAVKKMLREELKKNEGKDYSFIYDLDGEKLLNKSYYRKKFGKGKYEGLQVLPQGDWESTDITGLYLQSSYLYEGDYFPCEIGTYIFSPEERAEFNKKITGRRCHERRGTAGHEPV